VQTWQLDAVEGAAASMVWSLDWEQLGEQERSLVAETIAGFGQQYPTVDVRRDVAQGHPVAELTRQSQNACLLVVGTRGGGALSGWVKGSVSQAIVRGAHCPVAVVHPADPDASTTEHRRGRDGTGFHFPVPAMRGFL
jgi:nucleotide-binding universal stress UspA family protein